jgi:pimeloyl-ACP methyl ester carboxylesterase
MPSHKPTTIIVHGSWHSPDHYALLANNLESHGYRTKSVWLPSMHWTRHHLHPAKIDPLVEDIRITKEAIVEELGAHTDTDLVVLAHSSGTVVAGAAIEGFDKVSRSKHGKTNGVVAFAIISGILCTAGITVLDWAGGQKPPTVEVTTIPHPDHPDDESKSIEVSIPKPEMGAIALYYHDVEDKAEAKRYADLCTPQLFNVNTSPVPFAAWAMPTLPLYYLVCEDDHALPAAFQKIMIQGADEVRVKAAVPAETHVEAKDGKGRSLIDKFMAENVESMASLDKVQAASENLLQQKQSANDSSQETNAGNVKVHVTSIQSGHSPFLSRLEKTGLWLRRICGEKI